LPILAESRTGDTPHSKRQRQRQKPFHILLTTPESLALLLSYEGADKLFCELRYIIVDEIHAMAGNKRGDLLSLGLARLAQLAPHSLRIGLSATVAWPDELHAWLPPTADRKAVQLVERVNGAEPDVRIISTENEIPWSGHMAVHALRLQENHLHQFRVVMFGRERNSKVNQTAEHCWIGGRQTSALLSGYSHSGLLPAVMSTPLTLPVHTRSH
jgi:ATP-dependent Lhr-like helicase